jgi:hypothetical protein
MTPEIKRLADILARANVAEAPAARREYHAALCAAHPFQPGIVMTRTDQNGVIQRAVVMKICAPYGRVEIVMNLIKKDGTVGINTTPWRGDWKFEI